MNYTDTQLKQALAKMLPNGDVEWSRHYSAYGMQSLHLKWPTEARLVEDTELLHLCWMVESGLSDEQYNDFAYTLVKSRNDRCIPTCRCKSAAWQQRVVALAMVKEFEIV